MENPLFHDGLGPSQPLRRCFSTDGPQAPPRYAHPMHLGTQPRTSAPRRPWGPYIRAALLAQGVALALTMLPQTANATVVKALSLREKVEVSPVVLHGVVQRVDVEWARPGAFVRTMITLKVTESLKGGHEPGDHVIVYRGGGRIGDFHQTAPGLSEYEPGEEVVLFLEPLGATYVGIGIGIAKYAIHSERGEKVVTHNPNVSGVTFIEGKPPVIEHIVPMPPTALSDFLKQVRSLVAKIPKQPGPTPGKGARLKAKPTLPKLQSR